VDVLAWSPDGTRFATSSGQGGPTDQSVRLWHADGTPLAVLPSPNQLGRALAWSPDSRILATAAGDGATLLWSADGELLSTLADEPDTVLSLAWSPDGQLLAVGAAVTTRSTTARPFSGVIRLWRPDGTLVTTIRTQQTGGKFVHIHWSPDGTLLAGGAIDIYLWRADGSVVAQLHGSFTPAPAMAWSPRGDLIAIGDENGILLVYDTNGKLFTSLGNVGSGPLGAVWDLAFSPDGRTLAIFSHNGVSLLPTANPGAELRPIHGGAIKPGIQHSANLAWSPDGTRLATATRDGQLNIWSATGIPLLILDGCPGEILQVAWSPDGRTLIAGSQAAAICLWQP
jgi:WD40 repeat protein